MSYYNCQNKRIRDAMDPSKTLKNRLFEVFEKEMSSSSRTLQTFVIFQCQFLIYKNFLVEMAKFLLN
jgi:hypothetical protein